MPEENGTASAAGNDTLDSTALASEMRARAEWLADRYKDHRTAALLTAGAAQITELQSAAAPKMVKDGKERRVAIAIAIAGKEGTALAETLNCSDGKEEYQYGVEVVTPAMLMTGKRYNLIIVVRNSFASGTPLQNAHARGWLNYFSVKLHPDGKIVYLG